MTNLLIIVQPAPPESKVGADTVIAGLTLARRTVRAAERAGIAHIMIVGPGAAAVRNLVAGTSAVVLAPGEPLPELQPSRIVVLAGGVLFQTKWLRELFEIPIEPETFYAEAASVGMIETRQPREILAAARAGEGLPDIAGAAKTLAHRTFPHEGRFVITDPQDCRLAESWLLRGLIKETEGFMSRHVERPISLAISRRLASTSITPNAMTIFSVAVGLAGAPFFLSAKPMYQFTGALLFLAHSILDGCDGELARLKYLESRWGGILDFWGDNLVHVAIFLCMAVGLSMAVEASWPLVFGGAAAAGTLLSAGFVYRHMMRGHAGPGPMFTSVSKGQSWLSRMADMLARRDFIYVVVALSAVGKAGWFLVLAGIGAPAFFLFLLLVAASEARYENRSVT